MEATKGAVLTLKEPPLPVLVNGRERLIGGWRTASIGAWLITKKMGDGYTHVSEIAVTGYGRDSPTNRAKVRGRVTALRRWLADRSEFLLVRYGFHHTIIELKVCDPSNDNDRNAASEQLISLEVRGEVTLSEAERWREMLYLEKPHE